MDAATESDWRGRWEVVRPQVLDLDQVISGMTEMLRRTLGAHIDVTTSSAGGLWPVLADPGQMEQVLMNLAVNARDAIPGGGVLIIETSNVTVDADFCRSPRRQPWPSQSTCLTSGRSREKPSWSWRMRRHCARWPGGSSPATTIA